jgi:hypothetical protein
MGRMRAAAHCQEGFEKYFVSPPSLKVAEDIGISENCKFQILNYKFKNP